MASLDLWIEGDWGKETINWNQDEFPFDLDRFYADQRYANIVNTHVKHALKHLADELSEIALMTPSYESDWTNCE